jgi:uncharacterized protein with HEPN domain
MSPSTRDWRLYADDIVEACAKIRRFIAEMNFEEFLVDEDHRPTTCGTLRSWAESSTYTGAKTRARCRAIR